jgi:hypothetical protein
VTRLRRPITAPTGCVPERHFPDAYETGRTCRYVRVMTVATDLRPRLAVRWPFIAVALLALVAGALYAVWPSSGTPESDSATGLPTRAQAAPAERLVASLPVPAGAARDLFNTACGVPTPYCITSSRVSAPDLTRAVVGLMVARGARVIDAAACGSRNELLGDCGARLEFRGIRLGLTTTGAQTRFGQYEPTTLQAIVAEDVAPPSPTRPLAAWRRLALLPQPWGTPACADRHAGGCSSYKGTLTAVGSVVSSTAQVRRSLTAAGLRVNHQMCRRNTSGRLGCLVVGGKFRSLNGKDHLTVFALLHAINTHKTSLTVTVTADTL